MQDNYNPDSFEKGSQFEDYVEQRLFPKRDYALLHRTNTYDQNTQRYAGDSRLPDFRFKHILTGKEFHIEAKYRTKPFYDHYDILSETQVETFKNVHTPEIPIYIVLGYGGRANFPDYISLIPYATYPEEKIRVDRAYKHKINFGSVAIDLIHTASQPAPKASEASIKEPIETTAPQETTASDAPAKPVLRKKSVFKLGIAAVALLIILVSAFWGFSSSSSEPKSILEERIALYYQFSDANNLKALSDYLSPELDYWYGIKKPSTQEVLENIKDYRKKYPYSETKVDWKHFDITEQSNGQFYATYPLEYKVKSKENTPWRSYDLKLITVWDADYRLVSIQEVR